MRLRSRNGNDIGRPIAAVVACTMMVFGVTGATRAAVPLPLPHSKPLAPYCLSTLRYFGVGSVTVDYPVHRVSGEFWYRVPPHALPIITAQSGTMRGMAFYESQLWQEARLLARGTCRFLNHHTRTEDLTITDQHGRRIGMVVARLVRPGFGLGANPQ